MRRLALLLIALAALGAPAAAAGADQPFGISDLEVSFTDKEGEAVTQAGAHPYEMEVSFDVNTRELEGGGITVTEPLRDLELGQVAGFVGDPTAAERCSDAEFLTTRSNAEGAFVSSCPDSAAVGLVAVELITEGAVDEAIWTGVFNLSPPPGAPAKLGFWAAGVPVTIELGVNQSPPYNILGGPTNVSQVLEVAGSRLILWGVPADPDHDPLRGICAAGRGAEPKSLGDCEASVSEEPFLTLPRACEGQLETTYEARSWPDGKGGFATAKGSAPRAGMSGCAKLGFGPEVAVAPTTAAAESSSGLEVEIEVEDEGLTNPDYEAVAQADIAATEFRLPAGMTVNPSAAAGLGVCPPAQYAAASLADPGCPGASKLGAIEVETPILKDHVFTGSFYLAQPDNPSTPQAGAENPFDSLLAAYLIVRDQELGVLVKRPVRIETDPATGRIITTVEDIPAFPFSRIAVRLRSGPRAPLITPPTCGPHATTAVLTPSSGAAPLVATSTFDVTSGPGGGPCPAGAPPFSPGFEAGTLSNAAGSYSPFLARFTRRDGEQDLTRLSATLAPGLLGSIAGVARCPDAAIAAAAAKTGLAELAAPSCPPASRIGSVLAGAGVGSALTHVPGSLYLAGPFNGTPLSLVAIVPAVAGPFDVGTVLTRLALRLDPDTAQVEIDGGASDPIPHILKGVPLKLRDLRVAADRPGFTLNATSCAPAAVTATLFGSFLDPFSPADDVAVAAASRYQAASCASLGFKPRLKLWLKGRPRRAANSTLRAELRPRPGDANLRGAVVVLPPSQFIDNSHISNPCTRVQFAAGECPKSSVLGRARAFTPLLDEPLEGPVYFRSNGGERKLPDLVASLRGPFEFNLVIAILQSKNARVRTKVLNAPDAPVSRFVLRMFGGRRSLLENSEHLCRKRQRAAFHLTGQNGRRLKVKPVIRTSCQENRKRGSSKRHRRAR